MDICLVSPQDWFKQVPWIVHLIPQTVFTLEGFWRFVLWLGGCGGGPLSLHARSLWCAGCGLGEGWGPPFTRNGPSLYSLLLVAAAARSRLGLCLDALIPLPRRKDDTTNDNYALLKDDKLSEFNSPDDHSTTLMHGCDRGNGNSSSDNSVCHLTSNGNGSSEDDNFNNNMHDCNSGNGSANSDNDNSNNIMLGCESSNGNCNSDNDNSNSSVHGCDSGNGSSNSDNDNANNIMRGCDSGNGNSDNDNSNNNSTGCDSAMARAHIEREKSAGGTFSSLHPVGSVPALGIGPTNSDSDKGNGCSNYDYSNNNNNMLGCDSTQPELDPEMEGIRLQLLDGASESATQFFASFNEYSAKATCHSFVADSLTKALTTSVEGATRTLVEQYVLALQCKITHSKLCSPSAPYSEHEDSSEDGEATERIPVPKTVLPSITGRQCARMQAGSSFLTWYEVSSVSAVAWLPFCAAQFLKTSSYMYKTVSPANGEGAPATPSSITNYEHTHMQDHRDFDLWMQDLNGEDYSSVQHDLSDDEDFEICDFTPNLEPLRSKASRSCATLVDASSSLASRLALS